MKSSSQSRGRVQALIHSLTVGTALVALTSEIAGAAPQTATDLVND